MEEIGHSDAEHELALLIRGRLRPPSKSHRYFSSWMGHTAAETFESKILLHIPAFFQYLAVKHAYHQSRG